MSALWKLFFSRAATFDNGGTVATFPLLNETHMGHFLFDMFGKGAIAVVEKIAWHYLLRMSQLERVKRLRDLLTISGVSRRYFAPKTRGYKKRSLTDSR